MSVSLSFCLSALTSFKLSKRNTLPMSCCSIGQDRPGIELDTIGIEKRDVGFFTFRPPQFKQQERNRCDQTQKRGTADNKLAGDEKFTAQSREAKSLDREEPEKKTYSTAEGCYCGCSQLKNRLRIHLSLSFRYCSQTNKQLYPCFEKKNRTFTFPGFDYRRVLYISKLALTTLTPFYPTQELPRRNKTMG